LDGKCQELEKKLQYSNNFFQIILEIGFLTLPQIYIDFKFSPESTLKKLYKSQFSEF
jgi:hypothetical protein